MTRFTVEILTVEPSLANEYEGSLAVRVEGHELWCAAILPGAAAWAELHSGTRLDVELWLERRGPILRLDAPGPPELRPLDRTLYEATATVERVLDEDSVLLATPLPLRLDLERSPHADPHVPELHAGDAIRVEAVLQADLDPG